MHGHWRVLGLQLLFLLALRVGVVAQDAYQGQTFTAGAYRVTVAHTDGPWLDWNGRGTNHNYSRDWSDLLQYEAELRRDGRGYGMLSKSLRAHPGNTNMGVAGDWASDWGSLFHPEASNMWTSTATDEPSRPRHTAVPWGSLGGASLYVKALCQTGTMGHAWTGAYLQTPFRSFVTIQSNAPDGSLWVTQETRRVYYRSRLRLVRGNGP